jgi:hypothetical protein
MNKKLFCLSVALSSVLFLTACGGGGDNSNKDDLSSFNKIIRDFNKTHENVIYERAYDNLTSIDASNFLITSSLLGGFTCIINTANANEGECRKNSPFVNVLYSKAETMNISSSHKIEYVLSKSIVGNTYLTGDVSDAIFPILVNSRLIAYSIDKCYSSDIINEIKPYVDNLVSSGFKYEIDGFYKKTVGDFVYAFGYKEKTISWNRLLKEYETDFSFNCDTL